MNIFVHRPYDSNNEKIDFESLNFDFSKIATEDFSTYFEMYFYFLKNIVNIAWIVSVLNVMIPKGT